MFVRKIIYCTTLLFLFTVSAVCAETLRVALPINSTQERYAFKAVADYFSQAHPGYRVEYYAYEPVTYYNRLPHMISGKQPVDVIFLNGGSRIAELASKNQLTPLTTLWDKTCMESYTKDQQSIMKYGADFFAVPFSKYTFGLFYNRNLFLKYGIDPPKNWNEFISTANKLKRFGYAPLAIGGKNSNASSDWFSYISIKLNGRNFHQDFMTGKISLFDKRTEKALSLLKSLHSNGYLIPNHDKMTEREASAYLLREKAGMMLLPNSFSSALPADVRKTVEFIRFPAITKAYENDEGMFLNTFAVPGSAAHKKAASVFLKFILRSDTQSMLNKLMLTLPSNPKSFIEDDCRFLKTGNDIISGTGSYSHYSPSEALWETDGRLNNELNNLLKGTEIKIVQQRLEAMRLERAAK